MICRPCPDPCASLDTITQGALACSKVTDDSGLSLYVLTRDVDVFFAKYDSTVQALLKKYGYTGLFFGAHKNKQDSTCPSDIYWPSWSPSETVAPAVASACEYYHKIADDECADACIPPSVGLCPRSLVVSGGNLEAGECAEIGYAVADGTEDVTAGPCGEITFDKYAKAVLA